MIIILKGQVGEVDGDILLFGYYILYEVVLYKFQLDCDKLRMYNVIF